MKSEFIDSGDVPIYMDHAATTALDPAVRDAMAPFLERSAGKQLFFDLDRRGVYVSLGSACSSSDTAPSPVLLAIGLDPAAARRTVRFSLSRGTTRKELTTLFDGLDDILAGCGR